MAAGVKRVGEQMVQRLIDIEYLSTVPILLSNYLINLSSLKAIQLGKPHSSLSLYVDYP